MTSAKTSDGQTAASTVAPSSPSVLQTTHGKTVIADTVVSKIAGLAAREVHGVYDLGGNTSRVVGSLRERIPGATTNFSQGVSVEVGEKQAAIDIDIVAEYGVSIADLAGGIRRNVIAAIERMTGLEVIEVDITVHDIHVDDDSDTKADDESHAARVQ